MNPHVKSVHPLDNFELDVEFENGESRRFDVKPYLGRGIFVRLRDQAIFRGVRVIAGSIEWPGGLDLSYDTLYLNGRPVNSPTVKFEPGKAVARRDDGALNNVERRYVEFQFHQGGRLGEIPTVRIKHASYENIVAECPACGKDNIFNRASDLNTFEPVGGLNIACQIGDCGRPFRMISDSINSAHEMLIYDCCDLLDRKHYMGCILNLAQSYEVFFSLFFRVELLYKPFGSDPTQRIEDLNDLSSELQKKIEKFTFAPLRALFLSHIVAGYAPDSLAEAVSIVSVIPKYPREPKDALIEKLADAKLVSLLKALKGTSIHTLRNKIVHKRAFRPTRDEVDAALEETRSILMPLTSRLRLNDEVNLYTRAS